MSEITETKSLRERSGNISTDDCLAVVLYSLLYHEGVHSNHIETAVRNAIANMPAGKPGLAYHFANGWYGQYALDLARRIREGK